MVKVLRPVALNRAAIADLLESWERSLRAANKREKTIETYTLSVRRYLAWREDRRLRAGIGDVTREDVEMFISELLTALKPASVDTYYQGLKRFMKWCTDEGEIEQDPTARVKGPKVIEQPPIILADVDLDKLLAACEGRAFDDRRDTAIIQLLISTPIRRGGIAGLKLDDLDLPAKLLRVTLKGGREHLTPFDSTAALALDRYLRVRRLHRLAHLPDLWLGKGRALGYDGIYHMLKRRAAQAGLGHLSIHPHLFRHRWTHDWLAGEGSELGAMRIAGWKTGDMLKRYGALLADERAIEEYRRRRR